MPTAPISASQPVTPAAGQAAPTAQSNFVGEEFNQFLQLLTTQVENQDPLKPLDSTAFVEQLATFSALEQQVKTNQTLDNILVAIENA